MSLIGDRARVAGRPFLHEVLDFARRAAFARRLQTAALAMLRTRLGLITLVVLGALAAVLLASTALPRPYAATARLLLPAQPIDLGPFVVRAAAYDVLVSAERDSRILSVQHLSPDPRSAAAVVNGFVRSHAEKGMVLIDEASVPYEAVGPGLGLLLAAGAVVGLALGFALAVLRERRRAPIAAKRPSFPMLMSPERIRVRQAIMFARWGTRTLLVTPAVANAPPSLKPVPGVANLFILLGGRGNLPALIPEAEKTFRVIRLD
jgi:hypothetical protein